MKKLIAGTALTTAKLTSANGNASDQWLLPEECPIALKINGETYAVMLATPLNLSDFTFGFCLSEGLVTSAKQIKSISEKQIKHGFEVNIQLTEPAFDRFNIIDKRRRMAGASGCGICGLTSISHVVEDLPKVVSEFTISTTAIHKAKAQLADHTPLKQASYSVHAAAFANENGDVLMVREDVGRHNALDKLFGALIAEGLQINQGFILLTSRFAYELAQKCVRLGVPIAVSISAPTEFAVKIAKQSNMTYAALVDDEKLMIFSAENRIHS